MGLASVKARAVVSSQRLFWPLQPFLAFLEFAEAHAAQLRGGLRRAQADVARAPTKSSPSAARRVARAELRPLAVSTRRVVVGLATRCRHGRARPRPALAG